MPDNQPPSSSPPPQPPPQPPPAAPPASPPPAAAGDTQALIEGLRREAADARSQIRTLESQIAVASDSGKSELERANARAERAEKKLSGVEGTLMRQGVATAKGVPVELLAAPAADDRAGLEAHADRLAKWAQGLVDGALAEAGRPRRSTVLDPGRGAPIGDKADMNDFIRQGFRR